MNKMSIDLQKKMEALLNGDFKDFQKPEPEQIQESVWDIEQFEVEEEKTIVESLFESFDRYNTMTVTDEDSELIEKLGISDEIFAIQEALDSIKEKMLDESVADIVASSPMLLPIITAGIASLVAWVFKRKVAGDSAIPRPVVNTMFAINQFLEKGSEEKLKAAIKAKQPNLSDREINSVLSLVKKNSDKLNDKKRVLYAGQKKYNTDFAKINQERFNLKPVSK